MASMKDPMWIAVDVDGTLERDGELNIDVVEYLKKKKAEVENLQNISMKPIVN